MAATLPNGSVDIIKIINKGIPVRKWIRDSWARKKITEIQQRIGDIVVPTKTSQLQNDSGFITQADVPPGSTASSTTPLMDGTAAVGTETAFARGDHRHPTDTSRQAALSATQLAAVNSGVTAAKVAEWDGITVPTKTSELTNDSGFITGYTETDPTVPAWAKASTKPSYTASEVGALPNTTAIPSKTSDLTNDSGFITGYTETDPTVPSWAKQSTKPSYTAAEVGALPSTTHIPTKTSDLTNDSGFITSYTETDPTVPAWAKSATKPTYTASEVGALPNTTEIPSKTSDLTNDSDFQTGTDVEDAIGAEAGLMVPYGYCTTAAGTVAKTVTVSPAVTALTAGLCIVVKFQHANTAASPTLNVSGLGAKAIKRFDTTAPGTSSTMSWNSNSVVLLVYDGTYWMLADWNNTTYSGMTDAEYQAGTSTSNRLITPARLKAAIELHAPVQSVNGQTGDVTVAVPTKTSDLTNDSGFITSAPVASVNGKTGAVSLDASDVGALPSSTAIPSKTSDLTNDSGFITSSDLPSIPSPSTANPKMDGTASAGSSGTWSRGDHVHPHDTSKQDALSTAQMEAVNSGITADDLAVNNASILCNITPIEPTLTNGSHDSTYGGCWYYKRGCTVTVHIGVTGLTASTDTTIFTLPAGYRPRSIIGFVGNATSTTNYGRARIGADGTVHANSTSTRMVAQITFDAFS